MIYLCAKEVGVISMSKMPFEPLTLPIDKSLIDLSQIITLFGRAESKIGEFNQKISSKQYCAGYAASHLAKMESLYSTKIEGTQTTIDKVYEAEADVKEKETSIDTEEVLRYGYALSAGAKVIEDNPITCRLLKRLHKILLSGERVRKNSDFQPGEFRTQQNMVGDHIPPIAIKVEDLMGNLENYINTAYNYDDGLPPLIKIAIIHAQFETIHPFPDGNGRVGRILIPLYLYKEKVISSPFFLISQELEKNKIKYYNYLQGTRSKTTLGFTEWIQFFLTATINQSQKDIDFIESLERLHNRTHEKMARLRNTVNYEKVLNFIFENPIFTISKLASCTGIPRSTVGSYVRSLEEQRIIFSDQKQRNRNYYFIELLDLLKS